MSQPKTIPLLLSCLLLIPGCSDPADPGPFAASFALQTAHGTSLPTLLKAEASCDWYLTGANLSIDLDETWVMDWSYSFDCTKSGGQINTGVSILHGDYTRDGDKITFVEAGAFSFVATYNRGRLTTTLPPIPETRSTSVPLAFVQLP